MNIHPTAVVSSAAHVCEGVEVGPYCVIHENSEIGEGSVLRSHVVVGPNVKIGKGNLVHSHAVLGGPPQDLDYRGDATRLEIGDRNVIREFVTINIGTKKGGGVTKVGSRNYLMACSHVAHDCILEDEIIITNAVLLAGHILVERNAVL